MIKTQRKGIYLKEWLNYKPYNQQQASDFFYLTIAQKIYNILDDVLDHFYWNKKYGSKDQLLQELSCFLTSYLEDLASDTKLWTTFLQEHQRMYQKTLPLVELSEDYVMGEPNEEDIIILLWYFFNCVQDEVVYSHNEAWLRSIASSVFDLLIDQWEFAPENNWLKEYYQLGTEAEPFFEARKLMNKLFLQSYLFQPDTKIGFEVQVKRVLSNPLGNNVNLLIWDIEQALLHNQPSRLLALYANEWVAAWLGITHPMYSRIRQMSRRVTGIFELVGEDNEYYYLKHLAADMDMKLTKKSLKGIENPQQYLSLSLVEFDQEWWMSGTSSHFEPTDEKIENEKRNILRKHALNALLNPEWRAQYLQVGLELFMQINGGHPIAFGKNKEIKELLKRYEEHAVQSNDKLLQQMVPLRNEILIQYIDSFGKADKIFHWCIHRIWVWRYWSK